MGVRVIVGAIGFAFVAACSSGPRGELEITTGWALTAGEDEPAGSSGDDSPADTDAGGGCDVDGDGEPDPSCGGVDCDDDDDTRYPGAVDDAGDDVDQNCDGVDGVDEDGDGVASLASGGDDCDDADPSVSPAEEDLWASQELISVAGDRVTLDLALGRDGVSVGVLFTARWAASSVVELHVGRWNPDDGWSDQQVETTEVGDFESGALLFDVSDEFHAIAVRTEGTSQTLQHYTQAVDGTVASTVTSGTIGTGSEIALPELLLDITSTPNVVFRQGDGSASSAVIHRKRVDDNWPARQVTPDALNFRAGVLPDGRLYVVHQTTCCPIQMGISTWDGGQWSPSSLETPPVAGTLESTHREADGTIVALLRQGGLAGPLELVRFGVDGLSTQSVSGETFDRAQMLPAPDGTLYVFGQLVETSPDGRRQFAHLRFEGGGWTSRVYLRPDSQAADEGKWPWALVFDDEGGLHFVDPQARRLFYTEPADANCDGFGW